MRTINGDSRGRRLIHIKPNQTRQAPGLRGASIREKVRFFRECAAFTAINRRHTHRRQSHARQLIQIRHKAPRIDARYKSRSRLRMTGHKRRTHFGTDFKGTRANGRPQPYQHLTRRARQRRHAGFQDATHQTAPACMCGGNARLPEGTRTWRWRRLPPKKPSRAARRMRLDEMTAPSTAVT